MRRRAVRGSAGVLGQQQSCHSRMSGCLGGVVSEPRSAGHQSRRFDAGQFAGSEVHRRHCPIPDPNRRSEWRELYCRHPHPRGRSRLKSAALWDSRSLQARRKRLRRACCRLWCCWRRTRSKQHSGCRAGCFERKEDLVVSGERS